MPAARPAGAHTTVLPSAQPARARLLPSTDQLDSRKKAARGALAALAIPLVAAALYMHLGRGQSRPQSSAGSSAAPSTPVVKIFHATLKVPGIAPLAGSATHQLANLNEVMGATSATRMDCSVGMMTQAGVDPDPYLSSGEPIHVVIDGQADQVVTTGVGVWTKDTGCLLPFTFQAYDTSTRFQFTLGNGMTLTPGQYLGEAQPQITLGS
jgi:hypothetical protein